MMMKNVWNVMQGLKPVLLMVMVQIAFAGVNILYKLAVNDGMNLRILVAYRFLFATAFTAPLALILERKKRTKMTWTILFQSFLCGLFGGSLAQNFYLEGLSLTSATFASAMANLIPAITFILAVSFGLERLNLGRVGGKAKIVGTLTGICGAMVLTFVKGKGIDIGSHLNNHDDGVTSNSNSNSNSNGNGNGSNKRMLGGVCSLASGISYALWLIIQTKMSKSYPCYYTSTALMSLWASLVSTLFALCFDIRDWNEWRLGWNIRLLTVAYAGIVVSGAMVVVISWCVRMRGPLFASVFSPLMLLIVALAGSTIFNDKLHLGSIIGAVLIVCGLYAVLWGKSKEMKNMNQLMAPSSKSTSTSPNNQTEEEAAAAAAAAAGGVEIVVRSTTCTEQDNTSHGSQVLVLPHNNIINQ